MVNIVSIEWNVEEFRRLISDQPHSVDPDGEVEKAVRVLTIEVSSPPRAEDNLKTAQSIDPAASESPSSPAPTEVGASKNDNMSDPFVNEVVATIISLTENIEEPAPRYEADSAPGMALHILNSKIAETPHAARHVPPSEEESFSKIGADAAEAAIEGEEAVVRATVGPEPIKTADEIQLPMETQFNRPTTESGELLQPVGARLAELQSIQKTIFAPDIHTTKADRYRAIDLCWKLRDIAANRLKLSPIGEHDLQILIDLELVELRDGAPQLTSTGAKVIS